MHRNLIVVNRFSTANGVGNAAVCLFEFLNKDDQQTIVICMRRDEYFKNNRKIRNFPIRLPYTLEVLILPIYAQVFFKKNDIKHSFEVLLSNPSYFHIHFDHEIKKENRLKFSFRSIFREIARKVSNFAYQVAIKRNSKIVVPSNLLKDRLQNRLGGVSVDFYVLPNCLAQKDFATAISEIPIVRKFGNPEFESSVEFERAVALIANGDFEYKGLKIINQILNLVPQQFILLIVGIKSMQLVPKEFADRVKIMSTTPKQMVWNILGSISGVVIASPFESFSMVALEAITKGTPVLSLGPIGIQEIYFAYLKISGEKPLLFSQESEFERWNEMLEATIKKKQVGFQDYLLSERSKILREMGV